MPDKRRLLGDAGESLAASLLQSRGAAVVARNVRTRFGELDLIGRDRHGYVFVEVKTRRPSSFVAAAEAVDRRKAARLARLALAWLAARGERGATWRLAVIAITLSPDRSRVEWIDVD